MQEFRISSRVGRLLAAGAAVAMLTMGFDAAAYQQSPMLDQAVKDGKLPPVDQRVPKDAEVVKPLDSIGKFGGIIHRILVGSSGDHNTIQRFVGPQGLVRWDPQYTKVIPNLAKSWEVSPDAREYTFHLREGLKWSDGAPFTTEDIMFYVDDILHNPDYYSGAPPSQFTIDGVPMTAEAKDATTVTFKFVKPNGMFLYDLASPYGVPPVLWAKHYCEQFHPKYNKNIDALLKEYKQTSWVDLYNFRCGLREKQSRWYNPDKPTLEPWVIKEPYYGSATRVVMERNPYFWQVDTAGNQLPYVDTIQYQIVLNEEAGTLAAIGGQIDMQVFHFDSLQNRPVLATNAEKGHYRLINTVSTASSAILIYPNLNVRDPRISAMLNQKEFREALSLGIDRKQIIELVYAGQGEPFQVGPPEGHPLYNEQLATQFTDYDPAKANALLDKLGYDKRDSSNFRLDKDGKRLSLIAEAGAKIQLHADVLQLVVQYWQKLGIDARVDTIDNNYFQNRNANWEDQMQIAQTNGGGLDPIWRATDYVPIEDDSRFGPGWAMWYLTHGKEGVEPPQSVKDRLALYEQVRSSLPGEPQETLMKQVLQRSADAFEFFGITNPPLGQGIVNVDLKNVPDEMPNGFIYLTPQPTLPATYYFDR
jgi:peptide/nickel transport system substrate-binding protein